MFAPSRRHSDKLLAFRRLFLHEKEEEVTLKPVLAGLIPYGADVRICRISGTPITGESGTHKGPCTTRHIELDIGHSKCTCHQKIDHLSVWHTQPLLHSNAHPSHKTPHRATRVCGARRRSTRVQSIPPKNATCKGKRDPHWESTNMHALLH